MDANGLTAVDSTGIQLGNADIECGREVPNPEGRKHLPGHEHSEAIAMPWLTERRADVAFLALAAVGAFLALLA